MAIAPSTGRALPTGARFFSIAAPTPPNASALLTHARSVLPIALCGAPPSAKSVIRETLPSIESGERECKDGDHRDTDSEDQGLMVAWKRFTGAAWPCSFFVQVTKAIAASQVPRAISGSPTSRRPPATRNAGNSSMIASPEAKRAKDVRIQARKVRSFA